MLCVYMTLTDDMNFITNIIFTILTGCGSFILLFSKPKNKHESIQNNYIETDSMIYKTNQSKISDVEVQYLIKATTPSKEMSSARYSVLQYTQQIHESYTIMYTTNNPVILCERYKFSKEKLNELMFFISKVGLMHLMQNTVICYLLKILLP